MTFPAYPAYKNSGVQWIGSIPEHWCASRLRNIFFIQKRIAGKLGFDVLSITNKGVKIKDVESGDGQLSSDYSKYQLVMKGEFAMNHMDLVTGYVDISEFDGVTSPDYRVFSSVHPELDNPRFMLRLLQNAYHQKLFFPFGQGSAHLGRWRLPAEEFKDFFFPRPSRFEQTQIARFLDHETARIDALIEEQQRLIELLKEKRQAVISHAVTKGLDPTVQMKDSGVKWLGEVPAHWEITQIKRRCNLITDGAHISPETESGVYCFVSTRDVSDEGIDFDGCLRTSAASYEYLVKTGCQPAAGDVLFSKDGTIGRTIVVGENSPDFVVASSLIIIRPNRAELLPIYLDFMCQSWVVSQQVDGFVKGAGLPRLSIQNLTKVVGVFPPLEEQALIADFLQLQCVAARQLSSEAWRTMELLKERRSALISAAVTGKIDVRAWQPPASVPTPKLVQEAV
jgi:type I restriction enzyme S subunit